MQRACYNIAISCRQRERSFVVSNTRELSHGKRPAHCLNLTNFHLFFLFFFLLCYQRIWVSRYRASPVIKAGFAKHLFYFFFICVYTHRAASVKGLTKDWDGELGGTHLSLKKDRQLWEECITHIHGEHLLGWGRD